MFEFTGDVEPSGLGGPNGGGNGPGIYDPEYASWLHRTVEELVVLLYSRRCGTALLL
jgi:hypothetical protein